MTGLRAPGLCAVVDVSASSLSSLGVVLPSLSSLVSVSSFSAGHVLLLCPARPHTVQQRAPPRSIYFMHTRRPYAPQCRPLTILLSTVICHLGATCITAVLFCGENCGAAGAVLECSRDRSRVSFADRVWGKCVPYDGECISVSMPSNWQISSLRWCTTLCMRFSWRLSIAFVCNML